MKLYSGPISLFARKIEIALAEKGLPLKGPGLERHRALAAWYARVAACPAVAPVAAEIEAADRELSPALYA